MRQTVSNAEIVAYLKVRAKHDTTTAAADEHGIARETAQRWERMAKARGLTAESIVLTQEETLKAELRRLSAELEQAKRDAETTASIRQAIYGLAERDPEPPEWLIKEGKPGFRGVPMALWSDWHWGERVFPEQVAGVNEFDMTIAERRVRRLVSTTVDLCKNHMGRADTTYPGIVICLGGDMITGDIHQELEATNDGTTQQSLNSLTDALCWALETMADHFGQVFVPAVVGNHGRDTMKPRMKNRVYTSHEWLCYMTLARHFRNDPRIQFFIPGETDAYFKVYGHRFLLTHGDTLGVKGGDGIIGAIGPIMRGSLKVGRSEAQIGRDVDTILMGHWHQMLWLPGAIVNNCLKGYDEFARLALRAPYSRPSQALWFVHPQHGITARWEVFLEGLRTAQDATTWCSWPERVTDVPGGPRG